MSSSTKTDEFLVVERDECVPVRQLFMYAERAPRYTCESTMTPVGCTVGARADRFARVTGARRS